MYLHNRVDLDKRVMKLRGVRKPAQKGRFCKRVTLKGPWIDKVN